MKNIKDKIIIALDTPSKDEAIKWVKLLKGNARLFKIGLELFNSCGPDIINEITSLGAEIFLDLKLCDIPNTVSGAIRSVLREGIKIIDIHTLGGSNMLTDAAKTIETASHEKNITKPHLIGVTLLTSIDENILKNEHRVNSTTEEQVLHLTKLAYQTGLDGVVCSPLEIKKIKGSIKPEKPFIFVCPGIRPINSSKDDQKRTSTPYEALNAGADYIVIGRAVTKNEKPLEELKKIIFEVENHE